MKITLSRVLPTEVITPIRAKAHTPPYKLHKYFARRPWNVFSQMIEGVSEAGEIVLDPFCGGGVTVYEASKISRRVIGFDINPLSTFVVRNMVRNGNNLIELLQTIDEIEEFVNLLYADFDIIELNSEAVLVDWLELAYEVECPCCQQSTLLENSKKIGNGKFLCGNTLCESHSFVKPGIYAKDCNRIGSKYLFAVSSGRKKKVIEINDEIKDRIDQHIDYLKGLIEEREINIEYHLIPRNWDRQFEDQLFKKGIENFEDLFTTKNLLINKLLQWKIDGFKDKIELANYELLRVAFSNILKETNIMSFTNDTWQGGKPTTWSKHAYWLPSQYCEVSIKYVFKNSINRIIKCIKYNDEHLPKNLAINFSPGEMLNHDVTLVTGSISEYDLKENSIDAIVTDPPYGSNVQYLELSHFWYHWNKDLYHADPQFNHEAISNRKSFAGSKSMIDYERNLFYVFSKCYHVLKPERHMTLSFNNKDVSAWLALLLSIFKSGFCLERNGLIFQDGVANYKQTSHTKYEGSPFGDFIYIFKKESSKAIIPKLFQSEEEFILRVDNTFKDHLNGEIDNRNLVKRRMFLNVIPLVESYAFHNLKNIGEHNLYTHFTKSYFKKLYKN